MDKPKDKLKVIPKRSETYSERFERLHHIYDDGPKPKHFDDKSIVDMEKWNSMKGLEKKTPVVNKTNIAEQQMIKVARQPDSRGTFKKLVKEDEDNYQKLLKATGNKNDIINQVIDYSPNKIQRPKPFKNEDPSTYPMNQKKVLNNWEAMLEVAKNPKTPEDRKTANEYKRMIHKDYYNPKRRGLLSEEDLKFVGKHPTQLKKNYPEVKIPQVNINYKPFVATPGPSLNEVMGRAQRQPGLSKDLIEENAMIRKNIEYVLGEDQKEEVRKVELENNNNKENEND